MSSRLPQPDHLSYKTHRREALVQIWLPVGLAFLLMCSLAVLIALATSRGQADTSRWSAISTIWLTLPIIILGVLFTVAFSALIYVLALALKGLPAYTGRAQVAAYRVHGALKSAADLAVRPVIAIEGYLATLAAILGERPRPVRRARSSRRRTERLP